MRFQIGIIIPILRELNSLSWCSVSVDKACQADFDPKALLSLNHEPFRKNNISFS
jgi:hypothetical protein